MYLMSACHSRFHDDPLNSVMINSLVFLDGRLDVEKMREVFQARVLDINSAQYG